MIDGIQPTAAWGLHRARSLADALIARPDRAAARRELLRWFSPDDPEIRKRAADVARRISERDVAFLLPSASHFAALLAEVPAIESRTRWHLGLVVARSARSAGEIQTATELMWLLSEDASNVVRCSAVEGLGLLALRSPEIRADAEPYLLNALRTGTPAMRCRARDALARLERHTE